MRFLFPIILIALAIGGFFMFVSPNYTALQTLKTQIASYNTALSNSKSLEDQRDQLATKYNAIDPENLRKLSVMVPDSVDNIRLILEIENIASPYGMVLTDIKYDTTGTDTTATTGPTLPQSTTANKNYGDWNLEFSTSGTYANFLSLVNDLEHNLRIVDISSIDFSSDTPVATPGVALSTVSPDTYKFNFTIKTYWLKN